MLVFQITTFFFFSILFFFGRTNSKSTVMFEQKGVRSGRRTILMVVSTIMAALYALTWIASLRFSFGPAQLHHVGFKNLQGASSNRDDDRIQNRTLGFEKIIAIGLPERSDKRDALSLMASLSNVDIDWVDGVKMSALSAKSAPFGINFTAMGDNFLASWRSHMNAIRL